MYFDLDLLVDTLAFALSFTTYLAPHKVNDITLTYYLLDVKHILDGDISLIKLQLKWWSMLVIPWLMRYNCMA